MSRHDEIEQLEAKLNATRIRLTSTVTDLAIKLRPKNLANAAIDHIAGRAAEVARNTLETAKDNAGKATLFGAGALLAFDLGRVAGGTAPDKNITNIRSQPEGGLSFAFTDGLAQRWGILTSLIGGLAATGVGYVLGQALPVSRAEEQLLGTVPGDLRSVMGQFWQDHKQGAKISLADSFGIARFAAAGLGLMAAAAFFTRPNSKTQL